MTSSSEPTLVALPGLWLAFPTDPTAVSAVLQRCLTMVRAAFEPTPPGYVVRLGGGAGRLEIEVRAISLRRCVRIRFRGEQRHRKARLLKALVGKQYRGIVPRIRIRFT